MEAIILCGGSGWGLKPDIWIPKPKLKINNETLISHQINWLRKHGIDKIILAADTPNLTEDHDVIHSVEKKKLGTGGAVKKAAGHIKGNKVYVMNVDDIVFYDPKKLYEYADKGAAILMAKPTLPFGRIRTENTYVIRFEQKPQLDFYVSTGHYVFKTSVIRQFFPDEGDMELQTLQTLADKRMLRAYPYNSTWLTINTMKDLLKVREYFKLHKIEE
ncbi:MAG: sugar phosphate nucleotidyltransferase [Candidatus Bathyarchaeota archaeon]|nr:sugar phosphate nucleotidyltransferase [Candidatus Bathyarchaeota archaeon]